MEQLQQLLTDLECISLADISAIPEANQHVVAERLEQLQDELKAILLEKIQLAPLNRLFCLSNVEKSIGVFDKIDACQSRQTSTEESKNGIFIIRKNSNRPDGPTHSISFRSSPSV